ncbi:glycoside hydrolase family 95 protein [Blautia schinkii]|nr:glycoside hydrolase family 95 protein [Blautia schinkii]
MEFTQTKPASRFGEAYPVGNGQMGAVVYGSFPVEKLVLTENTFFSGRRSSQNNQPGASEAFYKMRELLKKEDYAAAHNEAEKFCGVRGDYGTNLPVGSLMITFYEECGAAGRSSVSDSGSDNVPVSGVGGTPNNDGPEFYERSLDYHEGIARSSFCLGQTRVNTETFASHPHHVLVWHMESTHPLDMSVGFQPYHDHGRVDPADNGFLYLAQARETVHCDEPCGVTLYGKCEAVTDGSTVFEAGELKISQALSVTLYLICTTDYEQLMKSTHESTCVKSQAHKKFEKSVRTMFGEKSQALREISYEEIRSFHIKDMISLMSRVELELEGEKAGEAAALFQYGRYLLLSSSREDSVLPAHLQGIWNDDVACRIGWSCDMHLDINTQMNYWPADVTNLPETMLPLLCYMEALASAGEQTAKESYGLEGWAAEIVSNAWCYSAPYWAVPISPYPTGGVWLLSQLWEHCRYTNDIRLLRDRVYPLMEGAARFFSGYVFEGENGDLTCGPSISAENSFVSGEESYQVSNGCTYELTVIRELFENYLQITESLEKANSLWQAMGVSEGGDGTWQPDISLVEKVRSLVGRLPGFRVLKDDCLAEWSHELPAADAQHRHTSHLLGLFPFAQITPEETPELADAAENTIKAKLTPYEQWEDTGWARSLLILYEARLHHGEEAWFHVKSMLENLLEPNGMIYHPPTRGTVFDDDFGHVYELDGNTGLTSGIAEMLLQSHKGVLRLLPALPPKWHSGHVKGLLARGGISVEIRWQQGRITEFMLTSACSQVCTVDYEGRTERVSLIKDQTYKLFKRSVRL